MTSVSFADRRFSGVIPPAGMRFDVVTYSKAAKFGCDRAEIRATGPRLAVYALLNWLRYEVKIRATHGGLVWNGYLNRILVEDPARGVSLEADLDTMINECAVAYTLLSTTDEKTGQRATTAWVRDEFSAYEYGRRMSLESANASNATLAENARDRKLQERRYPTAQSKHTGGDKGGGAVTATLSCVGWWYTLDWLYCNIPASLALQYPTIGTLDQNLGEDHDNDALNVSQVAQQWLSGTAAYNLVQAEVYIKRTLTPPAALSVSICADNNGAVGTSLGSGTLASASVGAAFGWSKITLSSAVPIEANKKYWVVASTSGLSSTAFYTLKLDINKGYADGICKKYLNNAWADVAADMPFRLLSDTEMDTSVQVRGIVAAHGQFFRGVDLHVLSGITSGSFRNGDTDALKEAEDLMEMGTGNKRRILAEIDENRTVRIYEEPAQPAAPAIWRDNQFLTATGGKMDAEACPVGFWAQDASGVPASVNTGILGGLGMIFVEKSEYDPETGLLTWEPLVGVDRYDLVKQG